MGIVRNAKEGLWFVGDAPTMLLLSNNEKDNKNKEKGKSEKEKVVKIIGGRDVGLKGGVVSRTIDGYLVLELSRSGEKVKVKVGCDTLYPVHICTNNKRNKNAELIKSF